MILRGREAFVAARQMKGSGLRRHTQKCGLLKPEVVSDRDGALAAAAWEDITQPVEA